MNLPTLAADIEIDLLPDRAPAAPNPADLIVQAQRAFRSRLVQFQKGQGIPFRNPPKPPADVVKAQRKMLKRLKRGLPLNPPKP
jgi:hypothetical protein